MAVDLPTTAEVRKALRQAQHRDLVSVDFWPAAAAEDLLDRVVERELVPEKRGGVGGMGGMVYPAAFHLEEKAGARPVEELAALLDRLGEQPEPLADVLRNGDLALGRQFRAHLSLGNTSYREGITEPG